VAGGRRRSVARARHTSRGKMLARQRVDLLTDPGTAVFLETIAARRPRAVWRRCAFGERGHRAFGRISGRECMIVANDATIKGGTYYPMTVKKATFERRISRGRTICPAFTWWIQVAHFCRSRTRFFP